MYKMHTKSQQKMSLMAGAQKVSRRRIP